MTKQFDADFCRVVILKHFEQPVYKVKQLIPFANGVLFETKKSASCSDSFQINILVKDNIIHNCQFTGSGCVISTSALDIVLMNIVNHSLSDAYALINDYFSLLKNELTQEKWEKMHDLICFSNIHKQANRIHCASVGAQAIFDNLYHEKK